MNDAKFSRLEPVPAPKKIVDTPPPKKEKSIRLTIDLDTGNRSNYIFSYEDLLKKARAKNVTESSNNGLSLVDLMNSDCDEVLKSVASKYEETYGRESGSKRRYKTYADLGAGYDDNDSFIDNTEANEEGIPEEMDTKKGGFYVNSGKLELTNRR